MRTAKLLLAALSCATLMFAGAYKADAIVTYNFNVVYTGGTPDGPPAWASLTITNFDTDVVRMSLTANWDGTLFPDQFIRDMYLNISPFLNATLVAGSVSGPANITGVTSSENGINGAAGTAFDHLVDFQVSGGPGRLTGGETVSWRVTAPGLTETHFMAVEPNMGLEAGMHIQGITGGLSGHVTTPEPASLFGISAGLLALVRARRNRK
ncbi:MAG: PEP-CTERM sorting domain-containing protein [Armatimonadetes bacterium]|nr:PEP-CTERM sorting domain-containing protein [Armatimonadota bacterium]